MFLKMGVKYLCTLSICFPPKEELVEAVLDLDPVVPFPEEGDLGNGTLGAVKEILKVLLHRAYEQDLCDGSVLEYRSRKIRQDPVL